MTWSAEARRAAAIARRGARADLKAVGLNKLSKSYMKSMSSPALRKSLAHNIKAARSAGKSFRMPRDVALSKLKGQVTLAARSTAFRNYLNEVHKRR